MQENTTWKHKKHPSCFLEGETNHLWIGWAYPLKSLQNRGRCSLVKAQSIEATNSGRWKSKDLSISWSEPPVVAGFFPHLCEGRFLVKNWAIRAIRLKNSMRQDVDQVHLLSPFSCPCAGGDVQGVYSEKIVLDVLEGPFSTIAIGGRVFDKGCSLFDVSMFFFLRNF